jgi:phage terminase large subunit
MALAVDENGQLTLDTTRVFTKQWAAVHLTRSGRPQDWAMTKPAPGQPVKLQERPRYKIVAHQGGTRSSKTYSLAQYFLYQCLTRPKGYNVTLVRQSLPALMLTALEDWKAVLVSAGLDPERMHNQRQKRYTFDNGNYLEYLSVLTPQDGQKIRGAKRVDLWCNEANELSLEVWRQLLLRTTGQAIIDFNPSDEYHWIWEEVETREDALFIISTYRDNPFLEPEVIDEIERYQQADPNYWAIYGEGKRGVSGASILTHWSQALYWPELQAQATTVTYGLDFGYKHPTALVRQAVIHGRRYVEELLYQANLTPPELIAQLGVLIPDRNSPIFADAARPELIKDIKNNGFNGIVAADKAVIPGIMELKSKPLILIGTNLVGEAKAYKYKIDRKTGLPTEEPVKLKDDLIDAARYAAYNAEKVVKFSMPVTVHQSFKRAK